jgi:hypothetical protein
VRLSPPPRRDVLDDGGANQWVPEFQLAPGAHQEVLENQRVDGIRVDGLPQKARCSVEDGALVRIGADRGDEDDGLLLWSKADQPVREGSFELHGQRQRGG